MAEPADMVLPLLREIQADLASFRKETLDRLTKLEAGQRNIRQAVAGDAVLGRMVVKEYDDRIAALDAKVAAREGSR